MFMVCLGSFSLVSITSEPPHFRNWDTKVHLSQRTVGDLSQIVLASFSIGQNPNWLESEKRNPAILKTASVNLFLALDIMEVMRKYIFSTTRTDRYSSRP